MNKCDICKYKNFICNQYFLYCDEFEEVEYIPKLVEYNFYYSSTTDTNDIIKSLEEKVLDLTKAVNYLLKEKGINK